MTLVNIYTIENLSELKCKYSLHLVKGISPTSEDYDKNVNLLGKRLSGITQSPCVPWKEGNSFFIAQPFGCKAMPETLPLIGTEALIDKAGIEREMKFDSLSENIVSLAVRFFQYYLENPLHTSPFLWKPNAGAPFYQKTPDEVFAAIAPDVNMYKGFKLRIIIMPGHKLGICVDVSRMYAAKQPLPAKITPDDLRRHKGKKCIYEYGNRWYVVKIAGLSDFNVGQQPMPGGKSLFQDIHEKSGSHKSPLVLRMSPDCSVLTYKTTTGETRNVPSALLRTTFRTNHSSISKYHSKTIIPPHLRRRDIEFFVRTHLRNLNFQGIPIVLSEKMIDVQTEVLIPPDLLFGNGKILSVRSGNGKIGCSIENFGMMKNALLYAKDAGYFARKVLDQQYIVMPKSAMTTYGETYIEDIKAQVRKAYSPDGLFPYNPAIIEYDDSIRQSIYELGKKIISEVEKSVFFSGYGLIVIPRLRSEYGTKEDALANLLMTELRKKGVFVSISHTDMPMNSYAQAVSTDGMTTWQITKDERKAGRFKGYLGNLVLNKVLLLNSCWPFVLGTPLHADVVVGIDIKNSTSAFVAILKDGKTLVFQPSESTDREQLGKKHVEMKIYSVLKKALEGSNLKPKSVVVHRDGRLFGGEMKGARAALDRLVVEDMVDKDCKITFIEIRKTSSIPVRFFEVDSKDPRGERTFSPKFGTFKIFESHAFVCTTGWPFMTPGTARPLHIIKVEGDMSVRKIIEDVFSLSNLTWTKVDFCSREPISIRMADIRLREFAGDYDSGSLSFGEDEQDG